MVLLFISFELWFKLSQQANNWLEILKTDLSKIGTQNHVFNRNNW